MTGKKTPLVIGGTLTQVLADSIAISAIKLNHCATRPVKCDILTMTTSGSFFKTFLVTVYKILAAISEATQPYFVSHFLRLFVLLPVV